MTTMDLYYKYLTRDEISLIIHSVQRTIINLEKFDDSHSEIVRKHRVLLSTLLDIEQEKHREQNKVVKPETYK